MALDIKIATTPGKQFYDDGSRIKHEIRPMRDPFDSRRKRWGIDHDGYRKTHR